MNSTSHSSINTAQQFAFLIKNNSFLNNLYFIFARSNYLLHNKRGVVSCIIPYARNYLRNVDNFTSEPEYTLDTDEGITLSYRSFDGQELQPEPCQNSNYLVESLASLFETSEYQNLFDTYNPNNQYILYVQTFSKDYNEVLAGVTSGGVSAGSVSSTGSTGSTRTGNYSHVFVIIDKKEPRKVLYIKTLGTATVDEKEEYMNELPCCVCSTNNKIDVGDIAGDTLDFRKRCIECEATIEIHKLYECVNCCTLFACSL